jgi:hypothetical protein
MSSDLFYEIRKRVINDYEFKERGQMLRQGICPACGKKEMYTNAEFPWVLRCGRLNNCGEVYHVKELYPDLFDSWSNRFPTTEENKNPNAAAEAYLQHGRGFDLSLLGNMFAQETFLDIKTGLASATVRFALCDGFWERLIDQPHRFEKKANFKYGTNYLGYWWKPSSWVLETQKEIWIVEGIFDAIALMHHGINAVSIMSCTNYPSFALKNLSKETKLIWALDGDNAGRTYTKKHVQRARDEGFTCLAAQIPQNKSNIDWNDCHQRGALTESDIDDYLYYGSLLIAKTAAEKSLLMYQRRNDQSEFYLEFAHRMYWFKLDIDQYNKARQAQENSEEAKRMSEQCLREEALKASSSIRQIANCYPTALYFQENLLTNESWYYFRVEFPHDGAPVKNTFTSAHVASAAEFKKRLLGMAPGAMFEGSSGQLDRIMSEQLYNIKRVSTVDFIGYSLEHGCYVFGDVAVKEGKIVELNSEDYFDIGKLSIKSLNKSVHLGIKKDVNAYKEDWVQLIWGAFGVKGLAALTYWLGSLFAEQIRAKHGSYPFLEIVGEAGAGKSTLLEFLWKLLGRNQYEGFDPSKSSLAARSRNFSQVSNMPVVLIESDRERLGDEKGANVKSFDWDELKTAYNGRSTRARGMATGGNETYEPPFRGAIVISQNNPVNASEAILSRIVHLFFDRSTQTAASGQAADKLKFIDIDHVSGFILRAAKNEKDIMKIVTEKTPAYIAELRKNKGIKMPRLHETHAQMLALSEALATIVPITAEQLESLKKQWITMAEERQQVINNDHILVQEFWEAFDYMNKGEMEFLNHSRNPDEIAVNLNHFAEEAATRKQQIPTLRDLKKVLKTSSRRKFIDVRVVNSKLRADGQAEALNPNKAGTAVRCWIFKKEAKRSES